MFRKGRIPSFKAIWMEREDEKGIGGREGERRKKGGGGVLKETKRAVWQARRQTKGGMITCLKKALK